MGPAPLISPQDQDSRDRRVLRGLEDAKGLLVMEV